MKFNCDYFRDRREEKRKKRCNWHRKFLWWPTRIDHGECRWLETVERKQVYGSGYVWWEYRPVFVPRTNSP